MLAVTDPEFKMLYWLQSPEQRSCEIDQAVAKVRERQVRDSFCAAAVMHSEDDSSGDAVCDSHVAVGFICGILVRPQPVSKDRAA